MKVARSTTVVQQFSSSDNFCLRSKTTVPMRWWGCVFCSRSVQYPLLVHSQTWTGTRTVEASERHTQQAFGLLKLMSKNPTPSNQQKSRWWIFWKQRSTVLWWVVDHNLGSKEQLLVMTNQQLMDHFLHQESLNPPQFSQGPWAEDRHWRDPY